MVQTLKPGILVIFVSGTLEVERAVQTILLNLLAIGYSGYLLSGG